MKYLAAAIALVGIVYSMGSCMNAQDAAEQKKVADRLEAAKAGWDYKCGFSDCHWEKIR